MNRVHAFGAVGQRLKPEAEKEIQINNLYYVTKTELGCFGYHLKNYRSRCAWQNGHNMAKASAG